MQMSFDNGLIVKCFDGKINETKGFRRIFKEMGVIDVIFSHECYDKSLRGDGRMTLGKETLRDRLHSIDERVVPCRYTEGLLREYGLIIDEINTLKREKKAVILGHTYVVPEILYGVADFVGDSYQLSVSAKETDAEVIVFAAVKFMAETAKILNPSKRVLIPSQHNGCSLADSITAEQVRALREEYPDHMFICYINTSADVKAECDVTVTSSNVVEVMKRAPSDKIYFLPDELMGLNVRRDLEAQGVHKDLKLYKGACHVHKAYRKEDIDALKQEHPGVRVIAHPECDRSVASSSDFVGSTSQMMGYVTESREAKFFVLSECGLTARMQMEHPDKHFIGTCNMCEYMKANTLVDILRVLKTPKQRDIITVNPTVQQRALSSLEKMFYYSQAIG